MMLNRKLQSVTTLLLSLGLFFTAVVPASAFQMTGECKGVIELFGTPGNDTYSGSDLAIDVYHGLAGDDRIYGRLCDDWLRGNDGNDWISGGSGNDYLFGHAGDDFLIGNSGKDTIVGNPGFDTIVANDGEQDNIYCDANDTVYADPIDVKFGC